MNRDWSDATHFRRPLLPVFSDCSHWLPLRQGWPSFVAYHYPSDSDYDQWHGQDLTPWNNAYSGEQSTKLLVGPVNRLIERHDVDLKYQSCNEQEQSSQSWNVDRVGPFTTHGGNAWWQMSGRDALQISRILSGTSDQLFVTESFLGPVDSNNIFISLPVLHVHHVHLLRGLDFPHLKPVAPMYLYLLHHGSIGRTSMRPAILEHHSESLYNDPDGGADIHSEAEPFGYGILVDMPLDMTLEFNDYRPHNSTAVHFYVQLALKWVSPFQATLIPVSRYGPVGVTGFGGEAYGHQLSLGGYRWGNEPCIMWSTKIMVVSFEVVAMKHHNHLSFTHRVFLLKNVTPQELGLRVQHEVTVSESIQFLQDVGKSAGQSVKDRRALFESQTMPLRLSGFVDFDSFESQLRKQAEGKLACILNPLWTMVDGVRTDTFGEQVCWPDLPWQVPVGERWTHVLLARPIQGPFSIHSSWYTSVVRSGLPGTCPGLHLPCVYLHLHPPAPIITSTQIYIDQVLSAASHSMLIVLSCSLILILFLRVHSVHKVLL